MTTRTPARGSLLLIFTITFLNTAGMMIVTPVLPFLVQKYAHTSTSVALWVGVLASTYAGCALLAAPALGAISDRVGRRPVLLISLFGSAIGFVIFGVGGALWVLLLGRVIDGLTGGNIGTIFAYLADITPPEDRSKRFGLAGAISGIGFMVGPAFGGLLAHFGLNAPVFVAAGVMVLTALVAIFVLPESLDAEHRAPELTFADVHPFRTIGDALRRPGLRPLMLIVLLLFTPMAGVQSNMSVFGKDVIGWGPTQIGLLLFGVGVLDILVQGVLLRLVLPKIGERGLVVAGFAGMALGYAVIAVAGAFLPVQWLFVTGVLLFAASEGGTQPALHGLASSSVSHREQGWVMGGMQSMASAARTLGPLIAGALYSGLGRPAPYVFGLVVIVGLAVFGLPKLKPAQGDDAHTDGTLAAEAA